MQLDAPITQLQQLSTDSQLLNLVQAYLRDTVGSIPDHCNKAKTAIKQVT